MGVCYSKIRRTKSRYDVDTVEYITPFEVVRTEGSFSECIFDQTTEPSPCEDKLYRRIINHSRLITDMIDVDEVLTHLPFTVDRDVSCRNSGISSSCRVRKLLQAINDCVQTQKWEKFMEALRFAEYDYLIKKINGETTEDHSNWHRVLSRVCNKIVESVSVSDVVDKLYEREVLNRRDMSILDAIARHDGGVVACHEMLKMIHRRSTDWYETFKAVLQEQGLDEVVGEMKEVEFEVALEESLGENQMPAPCPGLNNEKSDDGDYARLRDFYSKASSNQGTDRNEDTDQLRDMYKGIRLTVDKLKQKRQLSKKDLSFIEDSKRVLQEIHTPSDNTTSGGTEFTLNLDTSKNGVTENNQVVVTRADNVSVHINNERFTDCMNILSEHCRKVSDHMARHGESMSDLSATLKSMSYTSGSCPKCSQQGLFFSDSAVFTAEETTYMSVESLETTRM